MTRAIFSVKQPPVTVTKITADINQFQICLNESEVTSEEAETVEYEYDYFEFIEGLKYLDPEDVLADPEAFTDYIPHDLNPDEDHPSQSLREEIDGMKEAQSMTDEALQDLILLVLGGE
ncbi:MAG: hypothetical protein IKD75_11365 [Prevotella sp.]|nr:hypothetical protein [Prevotella sp.]